MRTRPHPSALPARPFALLLALPLFALAACGGGDSSSDGGNGGNSQEARWDGFDWDDASWS